MERRLPSAALTPMLVTDGTLQPQDLCLEMARRLAHGGPWGQAFPEPLFHGEFDVISQRVVGERHLKLVVRQADRLVDAIAFGCEPLNDVRRIRAAFRLAENDHGDLPTLQLVVEHLEALD